MTDDPVRAIAGIVEAAEVLAEDEGPAEPSGNSGSLPPADPPQAAADPLDAELALLPANDTGNARRLIRRFGDRFRFVREVGPFVWTGTHWDGVGGTEHATRLAQETAAAIRGEVAAIRAAGPRDGEAEAAWHKRIARHVTWGITSGNSGKIAGMIAQAQPHCTVAPDDLDTDPLSLNCENGTLHFGLRDEDGQRLPFVERRPHRRDDLISKCCPVVYDPKAPAPLFAAFLARTQPDPAVRRFLQVWAGYCLTGLTAEQKLVFFHGGGANGKSTFVDVFARLLAGYAASLRFESLAGDNQRRGDAATPDLARLPGVRFLRAAEPEQGLRLKEAEVKAITGGEPLLVRHLHGRFFELRPVFKLVLSGNHKPDIRGLDEGIWRRILLVPWTVHIPQAERDPALPEKLWAERSGILNWALDGLRLYLEEGLVVPDAVLAATAEYRDDSDQIGAFLRACTEPDPGGFVQAGELYRVYVRWCEDNALKPWSGTAFGRALPQKGIQKTDGRVRRCLGIRLAADAPSPLGGPDDVL